VQYPIDKLSPYGGVQVGDDHNIVLCFLWGVGSMWIELEFEYGVVERERRMV
jgi:hypothetical protein